MQVLSTTRRNGYHSNDLPFVRSNSILLSKSNGICDHPPTQRWPLQAIAWSFIFKTYENLVAMNGPKGCLFDGKHSLPMLS
jgi:hypothetical protein